jgi:hypothetical protein
MKIPPVEADFVACGRTNGHSDMTKLIVAFRKLRSRLKIAKFFVLFFPYFITSNLQQSTNKMHTTNHLRGHKYIKTVKLLQISKLVNSSSGRTSNSFAKNTSKIFFILLKLDLLCDVQNNIEVHRKYSA